jgi:hypothetical protein
LDFEIHDIIAIPTNLFFHFALRDIYARHCLSVILMKLGSMCINVNSLNTHARTEHEAIRSSGAFAWWVSVCSDNINFHFTGMFLFTATTGKVGVPDRVLLMAHLSLRPQCSNRILTNLGPIQTYM